MVGELSKCVWCIPIRRSVRTLMEGSSIHRLDTIDWERMSVRQEDASIDPSTVLLFIFSYSTTALIVD